MLGANSTVIDAGGSTVIKDRIIHLQSTLCEIVEPDYGLLDILLSQGVLSRPEREDVRVEKTVFRRNGVLLGILASKSANQCEEFLEVLQQSEQQHVANFIRCPVDTADTYKDIRPLDKAQILKLNTNTPVLVENLMVDEHFLGSLFAKNCINVFQWRSLGSIADPSDRTRSLLDLLSRTSVANFANFVCCIRSEHQPHLVPLLLADGAIASFVAKLDRLSVYDIDETESVITVRANEVLSHQLQSALLEELKPLGVDIAWLGLRKAQSIHCYFVCASLASIHHLHRLYCGMESELRHMLESIFSLFLGHSCIRPRIETLAWSNDDYKRCFAYFTAQAMHHLPVELLELLLMKAYMRQFTDHYKSQHRTHTAVESAYRTLAAVCDSWHLTLRGWPQSSTRFWFRHKLRDNIQRFCKPHCIFPRLRLTVVTATPVAGFAVCADKLFVVCRDSNTISVFTSSGGHRTDLDLKGLNRPRDIAVMASGETCRLFIVDMNGVSQILIAGPKCHVENFLSNLSIKSTVVSVSWSDKSSQLLVTTDSDNLLLWKDEMRQIPLRRLKGLLHAVESSHGTIILCHLRPRPSVTEIDTAGQIVRVFSDDLRHPCHLSVDCDSNVFVVDRDRDCVLLLNDRLALERIVLESDVHRLAWHPTQLCATVDGGQRKLFVSSTRSCGVQIFNI